MLKDELASLEELGDIDEFADKLIAEARGLLRHTGARTVLTSNDLAHAIASASSYAVDVPDNIFKSETAPTLDLQSSSKEIADILEVQTFAKRHRLGGLPATRGMQGENDRVLANVFDKRVLRGVAEESGVAGEDVVHLNGSGLASWIRKIVGASDAMTLEKDEAIVRNAVAVQAANVVRMAKGAGGTIHVLFTVNSHEQNLNLLMKKFDWNSWQVCGSKPTSPVTENLLAGTYYYFAGEDPNTLQIKTDQRPHKVSIQRTSTLTQF